MLPFLGAMFMFPFLESLPLQVGVPAIGAIAMVWLYLHWVPLVKA